MQFPHLPAVRLSLKLLHQYGVSILPKRVAADEIQACTNQTSASSYRICRICAVHCNQASVPSSYFLTYEDKNILENLFTKHATSDQGQC